jgi:hypothetical protein
MKFVKSYKGWKIAVEKVAHRGSKIDRYEARKGGDVIANGLSLSHLEMLIRYHAYAQGIPECYR